MESQATERPPPRVSSASRHRGIKSADSVFGLVSPKIVRYILLFSNNRVVVTMAVLGISIGGKLLEGRS